MAQQIHSKIHTPGETPARVLETCIGMLIVFLLLMAPNWELPKCLLIVGCLNKLYYVHTMSYYTEVKWMNRSCNYQHG